jgi:predicted ABC-type ATPase
MKLALSVPGGKLDVLDHEGKSATRRVRTAEGAERYHLPIGAPIFGHAAVPSPRAHHTAGNTAPLTDEQATARAEMVEQILGEKIARKQTSDAEFTLDPNHKVWAPERAKKHKEIVDDLYARASGVPTDGKAVIAGGLGGSGKSTVLKGPANIDQSKYLTINPDDIKELMVERGMVPTVPGLSPMESSPLVHEESSHIANLLAQRAYADRKNVIWDITMSSRGSVERRIAEMRDNGYSDVGAVFVDIPVETSVARAMKRWRRGADQYRSGQGPGGRYVPPSIIRKNASSKSASANRDVFDELRDQFDEWSVYDNSGTGPVRVGSSGGEGTR